MIPIFTRKFIIRRNHYTFFTNKIGFNFQSHFLLKRENKNLILNCFKQKKKCEVYYENVINV